MADSNESDKFRNTSPRTPTTPTYPYFPAPPPPTTQPFPPPQYIAPPTYPSYNPYDMNYSFMTQQPMSFMNMLNSGHPLIHTSPSTHSSETHSLKRPMAIDLEDDAASPSKSKSKKRAVTKRKMPPKVLNKKENTRGVPNAKWTAENDDVLIPFLAQMAKDGLKVDKNFKVLAYRRAAEEVNKKCGTEFTKENVMNHVKSLKGKYFDMRTVMDMSGAGYDPQTKIVTMDPDCFDRWTQVIFLLNKQTSKIYFLVTDFAIFQCIGKKCNSSRLKEYLNTPLIHYENLCYIAGDDQAKGDFTKDMTEKLGSRQHDTDRDEDHVILSDNEVDLSPSPRLESEKSSGQNHNSQGNKSKASSGVASASIDTSTPRKKSSKAKEDETLMRGLIDTMSFSIKNQHVHQRVVHWSETMANALMTHESEFSEGVLDKVLDYLYDHESEARRLIIKTKNSQKLFIEKIINEQGFDL